MRLGLVDGRRRDVDAADLEDHGGGRADRRVDRRRQSVGVVAGAAHAAAGDEARRGRAGPVVARPDPGRRRADVEPQQALVTPTAHEAARPGGVGGPGLVEVDVAGRSAVKVDGARAEPGLAGPAQVSCVHHRQLVQQVGHLHETDAPTSRSHDNYNYQARGHKVNKEKSIPYPYPHLTTLSRVRPPRPFSICLPFPHFPLEVRPLPSPDCGYGVWGALKFPKLGGLSER